MTTPKLDVKGVPAGEDAAMYLNSLSDQRAVGAYMPSFLSTVGIPPDDPETVELVRIRNAVAQACEY